MLAVFHFSPQFQISAWAETCHVIAILFQSFLARTKTERRVIGPLITSTAHRPGLSPRFIL